MIYLWVALGGALGSVARFWLNNAVAAVAGAEFPWGTLLINVLGSFIISFFGTLTTKAARFAVPPEITIFVMVGICGGFTTFSSFSLQTVQLARAGEWERVGWYVSASVILCVLFCWLGVISGLALSGRTTVAGPAATAMSSTRAVGVTQEPPMGNRSGSAAGAVLAILPNAEGAAMLLDSANVLANILGTSLAVLHVRVDPQSTVIASAEVLTLTAAEEISRTQDQLQTAVEQAVADWRDAHPAVALTFLEPFGAEAREVERAGRDARAIVSPAPQGEDLISATVNAAIFDARCPVVVLPANTMLRAGEHVAIGWKNIGHARGAIEAAMPLLAQASRITVIGIGDPDRLNLDHAKALLGVHAARATVINPPRGEQPVGSHLVAEADARGANIVVMGAHRHHRITEWVLGGVTGLVLKSSHIPLFLKH